MKTLILYESKRGSTQQYAEDIGKLVLADVMPLKKYKWKNLDEYDIIVFGGWVKGNVIQGVDDFLSHYDEIKEKAVIIFANGLSYPTTEGRDGLISGNILDLYHIRFYQFQGKFDFAKLGMIEKMLVKSSVNRMQNDDNFSEEHKAQMLSLLTTKIDGYDQNGVNKIVAVINRIISGEAAK